MTVNWWVQVILRQDSDLKLEFFSHDDSWLFLSLQQRSVLEIKQSPSLLEPVVFFEGEAGAVGNTTLVKPHWSAVNLQAPSTFSLCHSGLLCRAFIGTSPPASSMSLIKVVISFCQQGILYCFKSTTVCAQQSSGSHPSCPIKTGPRANLHALCFTNLIRRSNA